MNSPLHLHIRQNSVHQAFSSLGHKGQWVLNPGCMVDVVNTSNPRLSSLHNGALLRTGTFKRQHRLINHLLMMLQYRHCLQILTGYSKINFLHNVYFGLLIFSKLLKPPFIETATYYSVWDTSGISWTICKQSAPHCRQPHQHLIAHFLQAGCSS